MADYSLVRKLNWDGDVLHVHDAVREISSNIEFQTEDVILQHFDVDMSDFREYMHDKIKWEQKQWEAMPKWIPVTERLPETNTKVLVWIYDPDFMKPYMDFGYWLNEIETWGEFNDDVGDFKHCTIIAWMPLPEPPKEEDDA